MVQKRAENAIYQFVKDSSRPVSTREISEKLGIAWHTADRHCLKLQIKKKVDCFTIGKATAWFTR